jgi:dihydrofolate reductase
MRRIIHYVHSSVDGHIDGPGDAFDWAALGPELARYSYALEDRTDALLYGRVVWGWMSSYWPTADEVSDDEHDRAYAPRWRKAQKIVISRTLTDPGHDARVVGRRDLRAEVEALKAEPGGDLLLMGGSGAANALTALGLVDEYHVAVHPVVLGGGRPLFVPGLDRLPLELVGSTPCDGRTVVLQYRPAGRA